MQKIKIIRDERHRRWISSLPCCVTGIVGMTQAAHIRSNTGGGMGFKPSDSYCVPLSYPEHSKQHQIGERRYWGTHMEKAIELANALFIMTGNTDRALEHIARFQRVIRIR